MIRLEFVVPDAVKYDLYPSDKPSAIIIIPKVVIITPPSERIGDRTSRIMIDAATEVQRQHRGNVNPSIFGAVWHLPLQMGNFIQI